LFPVPNNLEAFPAIFPVEIKLDNAVPPIVPNPVAVPYPIPLDSIESPPILFIPWLTKFAPSPDKVPTTEDPTFYPKPSVRVVPFIILLNTVSPAEDSPELNIFPNYPPKRFVLSNIVSNAIPATLAVGNCVPDAYFPSYYCLSLVPLGIKGNLGGFN